jgi:hypothetical protein
LTESITFGILGLRQNRFAHFTRGFAFAFALARFFAGPVWALAAFAEAPAQPSEIKGLSLDLDVDMSDSIITLSKPEAGSRQLRTAITLWFDEGDPVSTHALAFAAYEIFHAVSLHRDPYRRDLLFDTDWIKDEFRRDWNKHIRREANFFKHGDRDPEETIEFNPDLTEWFILFATYARSLCREPQSEEETLFTWWFQINRPDKLTEHGRKFVADRIPVNELENFRRFRRRQFREVWRQSGLLKKRPIVEIV